MTLSWNKLEKSVREIASLRYSTTCNPVRLENGVNHDAVCKLSEKHWVIIEITKNDSLDKIRGDITRLAMTRMQLFQKNILSECTIVLGFTPTTSMKDAGKESGIDVFSYDEYINAFYNRNSYNAVRLVERFGSAVDVLSGRPDQRPYIEVSYRDKISARSYSVHEICEFMRTGRNIVLTGTFGSGKSRCYKELFNALQKDTDFFCLSIDLRDVGPLASANQIIRAHFESLGIEDMAESAVRLVNAGKFIVLLDGFDEMGGAQWSDDPHKLRDIRRRTLGPVRQLVEKSHAAFISGREHYFNSDEELMEAVGVGEKDIILECNDEFTGDEIKKFLSANLSDVRLPDWLPKRPLLFQMLVELHREGFPISIDTASGNADLWDHISGLICRREARINVNLEEKTILAILRRLGRESRKFPDDIGPVTLESLKRAYKAVRGYEPADEDAVLLQKLPGLGRISYESRDRRFVDKYLVDGFRGSDAVETLEIQDTDVVDDAWVNPLDALGLSILAQKITDESLDRQALSFAKRCAQRGNAVMAADLISALGFTDNADLDCAGIVIQGAVFSLLDLSMSNYSNLTLEDCIIHKLQVPNHVPQNINIKDCYIDSVYGISNSNSIPSWMNNCQISKYEHVENTASIKNLKLTPSQRILCVVLHKTFFQPGRGRQEEALLRGLGQINRTSVIKDILRALVRDGFLLEEKGRHGQLYIPLYNMRPTAAKILNLQTQCGEPIWEEVSKL